MMMLLHLRFGHRKQDIASDATEERIQRLNTEFHKNADKSIRDVRKINKKLSEAIIVKIHGASHVR